MSGFDKALAAYNVTPGEIQVSLGVSYEAVRLWRIGKRLISPEYVKTIEKRFHIPRHMLRPDIWDPPAKERSRQVSAAAK